MAIRKICASTPIDALNKDDLRRTQKPRLGPLPREASESPCVRMAVRKFNAQALKGRLVREQFCTDTRSQPPYGAGVGFFRCAEPKFPLHDASPRHAPHICSMMARRVFAGKGITGLRKNGWQLWRASLCAVC